MTEADSDGYEQSATVTLVRYALALVALTTASLFVLWTASNAFLLIFAGVLFSNRAERNGRDAAPLASWSVDHIVCDFPVHVVCLWLVGVGPSFALGAQAGILAFIPTVGPVISGIAIMLAGTASGLSGVLGALAIYIAVQTLDSNFSHSDDTEARSLCASDFSFCEPDCAWCALWSLWPRLGDTTRRSLSRSYTPISC